MEEVGKFYSDNLKITQ